MIRSEGPIGRDYMWPPRCKLSFYNGWGTLLRSSTARDLDLADSLMLFWPHASRRVILGMSSQSSAAHWKVWTEQILDRMEYLIRYDICFDGYRVGLTRLTNVGIPCAEEFRWQLHIQVALTRRKG